MTEIHASEIAPLDSLAPHPENYRSHPPEQIDHLVASMREHGFYRNVIVANDGTILAGHGVVEAARKAGLTEVSIVRMPFGPDDDRARKILVADNELMRLAETDYRALHSLVSKLADEDRLIGTGLDDEAFETLARYVDATSGPLATGEEWRGMPPFRQDDRESVFHTTVHFATEEDADRFFEQAGQTRSRSIWWPAHDGVVGSNLGEAWTGPPE